jgi:hypothetical protein
METIKDKTKIKWKTIEDKRTVNNFDIIRFDSICKANFYIGINENENKCLLLDLVNLRIEFNGFEKTNLKAYKTDKFLILELIGKDDYFDLFLDLSCAIFDKIKEIDNQQLSAEIFKEMILKWSAFFSNKIIDKLGEKEVMGLWGEIYILKSLIIENTKKINDILIAWRGPYDSNRDFEFSDYDIEVKTINFDADNINISSEFQLTVENDKIVKLRVLKVRQIENASTLKQIIEETINEILNKKGQIQLFYSAIYQKVKLIDLFEYDNYCFAINSDLTYNVNNNNFPKITSDQLFDGISNVKYKIKLSTIENFIKQD